MCVARIAKRVVEQRIALGVCIARIAFMRVFPTGGGANDQAFAEQGIARPEL
ncbi:MAG: hypothetical protein KME08_07015 [Aphanothece sp. CMT-3BRIN-NPC111]|nr:hypothetical protein [Aphanothece sp. CMT-3BRIN-NPC111]